MQKLDFVLNLEEIVDKLFSRQVVRAMVDIIVGKDSQTSFTILSQNLILSKANYDTLMKEEKFALLLDKLYPDVYNISKLPGLIILLDRNISSQQLFDDKEFAQYYDFHNTLVTTLDFARATLIDIDVEQSLLETNNIIVFQVVINGRGLDSLEYVKILTALQELIRIIRIVVDEQNDVLDIVLLDSGSDSNIGFDAGVKTASSLYTLFKEIWDSIRNYKFYNNTQSNAALLESLSIRTEIKNKVEQGVLTPEEGQEYTYIIKTRTESLIGMKVLPKQIILDSEHTDNSKFLTGLNDVKLLTNGDDNLDQSHV